MEVLKKQIKTLIIFIFLDIFFIGLILTKYFGKIPTYFVIYTFAKPSLAFLSGVSFDYIMLPQELVGIKFSLKQYFPNSSMDNKNVQSRSDELQRKHDKVKERMKHSCVQPCAICCLFLPGQKFINQQKKKEDDKNWNSFFNKKLLFYLLTSFLSKWHYERSTLILQYYVSFSANIQCDLQATQRLIVTWHYYLLWPILI